MISHLICAWSFRFPSSFLSGSSFRKLFVICDSLLNLPAHENRLSTCLAPAGSISARGQKDRQLTTTAR